MERSTPATPRRVSVRHMLTSAVAAIVGGQRIEFSGRGSRAMQRQAEAMAAQQKMKPDPKRLGSRRYGPVWTGMSRSSLRRESGRITASY
jgi:hypothetical protein